MKHTDMNDDAILGLIGKVDFRKREYDPIAPQNKLYGDDAKNETLSRAGKITKIIGALLLHWGGQITHAPSAGALSDALNAVNGDHMLLVECIKNAPTTLKHQTPGSALNLATTIARTKMPDPELEQKRKKERDITQQIVACGNSINDAYESPTSFKPYMAGFDTHDLIVKSFLLETHNVDDITIDWICSYVTSIKTTVNAPDVLSKIQQYIKQHKANRNGIQ